MAILLFFDQKNEKINLNKVLSSRMNRIKHSNIAPTHIYHNQLTDTFSLNYSFKSVSYILRVHLGARGYMYAGICRERHNFRVSTLIFRGDIYSRRGIGEILTVTYWGRCYHRGIKIYPVYGQRSFISSHRLIIFVCGND